MIKSLAWLAPATVQKKYEKSASTRPGAMGVGEK